MTTYRAAVGSVLREARREAGLTQREVAEAALVTQSSISNYEAGKRDVLLETFDRIAVSLGTTARALLDRVDRVETGRAA
ncbi:MAG: transcriptional regulator [Chloroflexi bacterium HGW-Chloroflexi-9]|nr:MAG: transcriptional regulator [Chloroflexi bacterium HGW-Chloroflexi-9]